MQPSGQEEDMDKMQIECPKQAKGKSAPCSVPRYDQTEHLS